MDHFYGCNTCTANIANTAQDEEYFTHATIADYLHSINLLENITSIQISTCYRYLSICFQNRELMEEFSLNEHNIIEYTITFYQDYEKKIRISIENLPIELSDAKIRQFLNNYVALIGNTYYPGHRYENKHFITGTRVYSCNEITNHISRHIYKFGQYLRIRYDNQPHNQEENIQTTTEPEVTTQQNEPIQIQQQEIQPEQI